MHLDVVSGPLSLFVQTKLSGLFLNQFFELIKLVVVQLSGDFIVAVDPAAEVDQLAAVRTKWKRWLIAQLLELDLLLANRALDRLHTHDLPDPPEDEDDEPPLAGGVDAGGGDDDALSALAALLYESDR